MMFEVEWFSMVLSEGLGSKRSGYCDMGEGYNVQWSGKSGGVSLLKSYVLLKNET